MVRPSSALLRQRTSPARPTPSIAGIVRRLAQQSRSLLDAVHREPAVQEQAAPVRRRQGHALHHPSTAARCSTAPRASGACNAGHGRKKITEAVSDQIAQHGLRAGLPDGPSRRLRAGLAPHHLLPGDLDHVFFTNSGSEAVDTALKIALAYHRVQRPGHAHAPDRPRARLSRRRLRRHLGRRHRHQPQVLRPAADRRRPLPHTHNLEEERLLARASRNWGAHLADELERIVTLHDASTIAAVIVEPVAGSTGVLMPPKGYLQKLREICDQARHPADLRRGHHRLRPPRRAPSPPSISACCRT